MMTAIFIIVLVYMLISAWFENIDQLESQRKMKNQYEGMLIEKEIEISKLKIQLRKKTGK